MAADDTMLDRGECPLCGVEFDAPDVFREHLGEVHDLYDEEGAATTTLWIPTFAVAPAAVVEPTIPEAPTPASSVAPEPQRAPVGLIVFVVLVIVLGGGLVLFIQSGGESETAADSPLVSTGGTPGSAAPSGDSGATGVSDTATTSGSTSSPTDESAAGDTASEVATTPTNGAPSGTVPLTEPAPPSSTAPVTTAPPSSFSLPTTTAAQVDGCSRDHGQWVVTYSWRYVGGAGWAPLADYAAVGGGRYRHTVALPANGNTPITSVGVVDTNGKRYDVALSPKLSAADC